MKNNNIIIACLIFLSTLLFISPSFAQDSEDVSTPCGLTYSATEGSDVFPYVIEENSYDICDKDIAYKMLYLLYGQSMDSGLTKTMFEFFHKPDPSTVALAEVTSVGSVIRNLYSSLTYLFFSAFVIVLSYQTGRYIYQATKTGDFMGNKDGNKQASKVAINALVVVLLATPVGSLILIQAIAIALAVPAIMLGNFMLSGFLSNIQTETTKVNISDSIIKEGADDFANSHIFGKSCEYQTQQAIFNTLYTDSGKYGKHSAWYKFWESKDPMLRAQSCNTYTDSFIKNDLGFLSAIKSEIRYNACNFHHLIPNVSRGDGSPYGSNHSCMEANFTQPYSSFAKTTFVTDLGEDIFDDIRDQILRPKDEMGAYYNRYGFANIVNEVLTDDLMAQIDILVNRKESGELESYEYEEQFIELLNESALEFKNTNLMQHILVEDENGNFDYDVNDMSSGLLSLNLNEVLEIGSNSEVFGLIYSKHLMAVNNALGGYVTPVDGKYEANWMAWGSGNPLGGFGRYGKDIKKIVPEAMVSGTEDIRRDLFVDELARNMVKINCAEIVRSQMGENAGIESFIFYSEWLEDKDQMVENPNAQTMPCIFFDVVGEEEAVFEHALADMPKFEELLELRGGAYGEFVEENLELINEYMQTLTLELGNKKAYIIAYNYIIKKAFLENLSMELKRNADFQVLADTRARGWAGLGSMMLAIASEQASASNLSNNILSTGSVFGYSRLVENGENDSSSNKVRITFVHEEAFNYVGEEDRSEFIITVDSGMSGISTISNFVNSAGFSGGTSTASDLELNFFQKFILTLTEFVFATPLMYLKMGSGMDLDKNIPENLNDCALSGDCYPTTTHPLNATIMFGQNLLVNALLSILALSAINMLAEMIIKSDVSSDDRSGASNKSSIMNKLKMIPVFKIIIIILKIIAYIIVLLVPPLMSGLTIMLFPAVLLGYILPMIPYLMSMMVTLSWYILIFLTTMSFPLLLLLLSRINENGQNDLSADFFWKRLGPIFLKPALITIAIVFSWVLVNISIYYINTTMFSIFEVSALSGGVLVSLIGTFLSYFIYAMVIYFVLQHSFSIILNFSDQVTQLLGMQASADQNAYGSLGVEKMLAAQAISGQLGQGAKQLGNVGGQAISSLRDKIANKGDSEFEKPQGESQESSNNQGSQDKEEGR